MNTKLILNPYYCYIISFGLALLIYSWEWSEIYPALSLSVTVFLIITFVLAFVVGRLVGRKLVFTKILISKVNTEIVLSILTGYTIEFIYNGGIPLFFILKGVEIKYMEFGIPTFHVFLLTFSSYYAVYVFHQYLSSRNKKLLLSFMLLLLPYILIVNRGAFIMILTACLIIYISFINEISIKEFVILLIITSIFFYGFGYLGNLRSFNGDSMALLNLTKATDNFKNSLIPKEFYWFYIYASSPFANFQNATIVSLTHNYDLPRFVTWELLPDFISKRIIPIELDYEGLNRLDYSINPILTVGSMYFEPFIRMGWSGPIIIFLFYTTLVYLYISLLPATSSYFLSAIAILCVISIFNVFENMLNFSGLSVQLIYPILFYRLEKVKFTGFRFKKVVFRFNK